MLEFYPMCFFILSSWYFLFSGGEGYVQATPMHNHSISAKRGSGSKVQVMGKKGKAMSPWSVGGA